jgi:hypothetical protein
MTIHGIMVAYIDHDTPNFFEHVFPDGSKFRCSFANAYIPWAGVSGVLQEPPRNCQTTLSKSYQIHFSDRHVLFVTTAYPDRFVSIQTRPIHIIRLAVNELGI